MSTPLQTVHLRVSDSRTAKPTAVQLRITPADNSDHPGFVPFGFSELVPIGAGEAVGLQTRPGNYPSTVIDGQCEIALPTGVPLNLEVTKGPHFPVHRETIKIKPGQMALRVALGEPLAERDKWLAVDSRAHELSPHDAKLEAEAEDLDFVNLLVRTRDIPSGDGRVYTRAANLSAFSGVDACLPSVYVNTCNTHPMLGALGLLASHRPIFPLRFGTLDETDDWSLCDWADQCHRKTGLTTWVEAGKRPTGGEALVAAILGKIDAFEIDAARKPEALVEWMQCLDAGIRLPLVGGSGKHSNRTTLGAMRTLTPKTDGINDYGSWVDAVKAGRTQVTNGPIIDLKVERGTPETTYYIVVRVHTFVPYDALQIVIDGNVVGSQRGAANDVESSYTLEWQADTPPQYVFARIMNAGSAADRPFAVTSPIFFDAAPRPEPKAVRQLLDRLNSLEEWYHDSARFAQDRFREQHLQRLNEARAKLHDSVPA